MKLAMNVEYRFNLSVSWKREVLDDVEDMWIVLDIVTDDEMVFEGLHSLKDLALGTGIGVRYDFSFFVIRCDLGFKTYNPANEMGRRWFKDWSFNKTVLNIGINYPF